jgi:hypothetical protein
MQQTNELRGQLGFLQDLVEMSIHAFVAADAAELTNTLDLVRKCAADVIKTLNQQNT